MPKTFAAALRLTVLALTALAASPMAAQAQACAPGMAARTYPTPRWESAYDAGQGWSEDGLDKAFSMAERASYASGMLVHRGKVVRRFGDLDRPFATGRLGHTLLNPLAGRLVAERKLDLDAEIGRLGIVEKPPLSSLEASATVRHLLTSTSGVHRLAADSTATDRSAMPATGSARPGSRFWYNKWGFNVLGALIEKAGAQRLSDQFDRVVARPLGMQDYDGRRIAYRIEERLSQHAAAEFELSTRDRARFGLFYVRQGCWAGRQILDPAWARDSLAPLAQTGDGDQFGYLWRVRPLPAAVGGRVITGGDDDQMLVLMPELDAVLVLTSDLDAPPWLNLMRRSVGLLPRREAGDAVLLQVLRSRPRAARAA
jgi:CubicO group peptidase (beta-lactamase class C family)